MVDSRPSELDQLRRENARLIALPLQKAPRQRGCGAIGRWGNP